MSPQKQRIAIATACGWEPRPEGHFNCDAPDRTMPDYLSDLNAMREARAILTPDQQIQFSFFVGKSVTRMLRVNQAEWMDFCLIDANAQCQAEAFLRTLGLWEEDAQ